jgi:hypothetical protein
VLLAATEPEIRVPHFLHHKKEGKEEVKISATAGI